MLFADVTLDTSVDTFPLRTNNRVIYPIGRYRTCLAHPELELALDRGLVRRIHHLSWYEHDTIFAKYMDWFITAKSRYRAEGNEAWATVCKYYGNSLYGKTGQRTPQWLEWGPESLRLLEESNGLAHGVLSSFAHCPPKMDSMEETYGFVGSGITADIRNYWGVPEIKVGYHESRDSCPAIAAAITSYARVALRECQAIAGDREWYYSDTDSLWVTEQGMGRLSERGKIATEQIGYLSVKGKHQWMIVSGPKDYATDQTRKIKGIRSSATPTADGGFSQLHFPSASSQIRQQRWGGVFVASCTRHLRRQLDTIVVGADGWTRPLEIIG